MTKKTRLREKKKQGESGEGVPSPEENPVQKEETLNEPEVVEVSNPPETSATQSDEHLEPDTQDDLQANDKSMENHDLQANAEQEKSTLLEEVESFFQQRDELAKKLAKEIEVTEAKLAELRRTAAMLFPERAANPGKDRKAKKPKKAQHRSDAASGGDGGEG